MKPLILSILLAVASVAGDYRPLGQHIIQGQMDVYTWGYTNLPPAMPELYPEESRVYGLAVSIATEDDARAYLVCARLALTDGTESQACMIQARSKNKRTLAIAVSGKVMPVGIVSLGITRLYGEPEQMALK